MPQNNNVIDQLSEIMSKMSTNPPPQQQQQVPMQQFQTHGMQQMQGPQGMMPQQYATSNPFSAQGYQNPGHNSFGASNMGPASMPLGGPSWDEKKENTKDNVKEFKDLFS